MSVRVSKFLPALVATAAVCLPCVAPEAAVGAPGIRVVYDDLNLATPTGVARLYARIRGAAKQYCGPARLVTGTHLSTTYDRCVEDAVATTVRKLNDSGLSALYAARGRARGSQG